ncbi:hypothetical protein [Streptomyces daliensis]|uniref:Uncharacterized protein n=1 Tax=Streptomyces daliensis TaxID=299421 RepID=A0A8T4ISJ9_9ACTN|nr:hypothetical protein [Streptomyces daliensis]
MNHTGNSGGGEASDAVHESYSFACMRCGHGWEQDYEIVHLEYADGRPHIVYYADGARVPSPLTHPTCLNCEGHLVRIMRSGRVSTAEAALPHHRSPVQPVIPRTA